MDVPNHLAADGRKEESLENCLRRIIEQQGLDAERELVLRVAARLDASVLDCAAALLYLRQVSKDAGSRSADAKADVPAKPLFRTVRYRLDVGGQHQVSKEQIQAVLIEESGVDKNRIGRIDIRHSYTLVELPDGMPADIFQLLSDATVNGRKLAIKRVKSNRRRPQAREFAEKR